MRRIRRNESNERGSVLVELTMVLLPLMLIVMGMVEVGGAWRDKSTAIQSSRQGARVGVTASVATTDVADREILLSVLAGFPTGASGGSTIDLHTVIIYDATGTPTDVENRLDGCLAAVKSLRTSDAIAPAGTTSGGAFAGKCNVYLAGNNGTPSSARASLHPDEIKVAARFDGSASAWDSNLPADQRRNAAKRNIGVYIEAFRPWVTDFFPNDGILITGRTVMRIEPEGF